MTKPERASGCSRLARRMIGNNSSPFNLFLFRAYPALGSDAKEEEEFLIRYNVNSVELDEDGFEKLRREITLTYEEKIAEVLGHTEKIRLHCDVLPLSTVFEKIVIREARVPIIDLPGIRLKVWSNRRYFEVCVGPALSEDFPWIPPQLDWILTYLLSSLAIVYEWTKEETQV